MTQLTSLICAMSRNHVIGLKNDLPWHLPPDFQHFKALTQNKPIIMGRLTLQSILDRRGGKLLPNRPHYVITRTPLSQQTSPLPEDVHVHSDLISAIKAAKDNHPDTEIMVIGGASVYTQAIPLVDRMYLTIIDKDIEGDAFFPTYHPDDWQVTERQDFPVGDIPFSFLTLERK